VLSCRRALGGYAARKSCSSAVTWAAMASAHNGERVADVALLAAGPPGELEVVAEALDPGGLADGEGAVEAVVEEPAAARVVEVGGVHRAGRRGAVGPRAGIPSVRDQRRLAVPRP
jgi:hypothetical protein